MSFSPQQASADKNWTDELERLEARWKAEDRAWEIERAAAVLLPSEETVMDGAEPLAISDEISGNSLAPTSIEDPSHPHE
ncbi:hypothetical protein SPHI_27470 [Sphingomonas jeddahensis]|uniref:Uncharacterized protein n=2 Tax=Sphingomonas jeddahensis TaxID=1915074 RepID=A0A1V2ERE0_9SPHN|nr:hypothetical protein SPHI_27470 [Sphingomonas jeddahensis]